MIPHQPHDEIFTIQEGDGIWLVDFKMPREIYDHFSKIIKKQLEAKERKNSYQEELINRVIQSMWKEIESQFAAKKYTLIRNDLISQELSETSFVFQIRLLFLPEISQKIALEYENDFDFQFLEDLKPTKNLLQRNTMLLGHKLKFLEEKEAPSKVDKIGRHLRVQLSFFDKDNHLQSEQKVDLFIVGLGLLDNDEFAKLKGKKEGAEIIFPQRRFYFGWDTKNENIREDGSYVKLKILAILKTSWRTKIKDLLLEEKFKNAFEDSYQVEKFVNDISKFEMRLQDNFNFCYHFMDFLLMHPSTQVSQAVKDVLYEGYHGSYQLVLRKPEYRNKLKGDLKDFKDEEDFIKKALKLEVDPLKAAAFSSDVFVEKKLQKDFFEIMKRNLDFYFNLHLEIVQTDQIMLASYLNYLTILQFMKYRNDSNYQYWKDEMFTTDISKDVQHLEFFKNFGKKSKNDKANKPEKNVNEKAKLKN